MKRVIVHPLALRELIEAAAFYESQSEGLGVGLIYELDQTFARISANPNAGLAVTGKIRRRLIRRFPFAVLYQPAAENLEVIAIAHLRRRPGYWKSRLKAGS